MVCALLGTIVVGMVLGYMFLDVTAKPMLDETLMAALDFMGFVVSKSAAIAACSSKFARLRIWP